MVEHADRFDELYRYRFEDLVLGMAEVHSYTITETVVRMFAAMSGDTNPIHLDEEFAASSRFGGRVAHGLISVSLCRRYLVQNFQGPVRYISQSLRFKSPVMIGDTVVVRVTITKLNQRTRIVIFDTTCAVGDRTVIQGEAEIYVPPRD